MIKFKNINGDVFLAVGSVKRKSALNGEKSLSATITQGDDVLNKIDKGWSLEFDNEPYVVTYFERNDNNNTVEIDAIHKFFWDMTKSVLYNSYSNSHVARFYLDEIFKDTGYTYALNFDPKAFEKENWGMKNKLSLFNDAISSMGAEFEINGTLISIFKNVGSDLSTIVRHGFNLSDMTLENDNANFATYGEGFGAYDDKENQKGPRLHVTYTSPLAKAFGKLHAEPIVDERYTVKDNLLSAVKDKVDSSFAVSVKLSLYDLTAAGYPYKMANVGDWLLAVDEHLDFKQKIRIISVDDEFAEDGTRISYTVTCGDSGVTKKYQDANAALTQKVQSAYENAQTAKDAAIQAVISSTGKNTIYDNIDGEENLPKTANEGDLAFVQTGDGKAMYIYTKMPDGSFKWVKRLDPDTGEQIAAGVEEAIATANKHTDELNEKQASEAANSKSEITAALNSASADRERISKEATNMTNSAMTRANEVANKAAEIDGKVVAVGKSIDGLTAVVKDPKTGLSAVADLASNGVTLAMVAQKDATTAITTAQGIQTSVKKSQDDIKDLQAKTNSLGQTNQFTNSAFAPDAEGWNLQADAGSKAPYRSFASYGSNGIGFDTTNAPDSTFARLSQTVQLPNTRLSTDVMSLSWRVNTRKMAQYCHIWLIWQDAKGASLNKNTMGNWDDKNLNRYDVHKWENISIPIEAKQVDVRFETREGTNAYIYQPMLVFEKTVGAYVPGTYNNNNFVESVRTQLANQITDEIDDRKNGDNTTRTQLTNMFDQRVTSIEKGYQSYFDQKADSILLGVGTPNMLVNSDFNPDLSGWSVDNFLGGKKPYRSYFDKTANKITVGFNTQSDNASMASLSQKVALASTSGARGTISLSWQARTSESAGTQTVSMSFVDSSGNTIGKSITADWSDKGNGWNIKKIEGVDIPDKATSLTIAFVASEKVTAYLTKPMLSFTNKAMPYMPGSATNSSTVLQLFKDNWSIGLADNLGKITSGIVADNNNMALINKNITLQGNTTVTADFYAKGGNFKNLNASNITTGTINAAKINVINLDVSSLSGNITNFVKSYWANAYSNVTIDGSGMTISNGWDHTNLVNGSVDLSHYSTITSVEEHIGGLSTVNDVRADNLDLISIYIDGYKNQGSGHSAKHGGDGFSVSLTNGNGNATMTDVLSWENELLAGARKNEPGWHFWDDVKFHQPVLITPPGAYQGILFSTTKMSSTTYPAIFGNQKKNDGPGIVMGSTELYFIYKGTAYPLSGILTNAYYDI